MNISIFPSTIKEWDSIAEATYNRWHFQNAFATADGKLIALFHSSGTGSGLYIYKGFYSVFLLALVDYDYKFTYINYRYQGRINDVEIYNNLALKKPF